MSWSYGDMAGGRQRSPELESRRGSGSARSAGPPQLEKVKGGARLRLCAGAVIVAGFVRSERRACARSRARHCELFSC